MPCECHYLGSGERLKWRHRTAAVGDRLHHLTPETLKRWDPWCMYQQQGKLWPELTAHSLPDMGCFSCRTEARGEVCCSPNRFGILPLAMFGERTSAHSQLSSYIVFFTLLSFSFILREKLKNRSWANAPVYAGIWAARSFCNSCCTAFSFTFQKFFIPQCFHPRSKKLNIFPVSAAVTAPIVSCKPLVRLNPSPRFTHSSWGPEGSWQNVLHNLPLS